MSLWRIKVEHVNVRFSAKRLLASFRQGRWCRLGCREYRIYRVKYIKPTETSKHADSLPKRCLEKPSSSLKAWFGNWRDLCTNLWASTEHLHGTYENLPNCTTTYVKSTNTNDKGPIQPYKVICLSKGPCIDSYSLSKGPM